MKNKNNVKKEKKMKLYIWTGVLKDWSSGMAVGLGRTKKEAAIAALKEENSRNCYNDKGEYVRDGVAIECDVYKELMASEASVYNLDKAVGNYVFGGS